MNIYEVRAEIDDYRWLRALSFEESVELDGNYQTNWSPLALRWDYTHLPSSNFVAVSMTGMAMEKGMTDVFKRENITGLQYLPIENIPNLVILNPLNIESSIDYKKAVTARFDDGRVMCFDAYAFHKEKVVDAFLFKIPEQGRFYATQTFKEFYEKHGWTGLDFEFLCKSE